MRESCIL